MSRLRVLFLLDYLKNYTDENHHVSLQDVQAAAGEVGISFIYKTFRDDLELLRSLGFDIQMQRKGYFKTYYLQRPISMGERKLMYTAVNYSKRISQEQKEVLIDRLLEYGSVYEKEVLEEYTP